MIAVDRNLLVYSHRADFPQHTKALLLIRGLCEGSAAWGLPWPCVHEFYRVVTQTGLAFRPSTPAEALAMIRAWCSAPGCRLLAEGSNYLETFERLEFESQPLGAMLHDAKIAAICLSHGVRELWSADPDFTRFPQLKVRNPLLG